MEGFLPALAVFFFVVVGFSFESVSLDICAEGSVTNAFSLNLDEVMVGIKVCAAGRISSFTVKQVLLALAGL